MAHIGRIFADEAGMLHAMRPAHQILRLNPPGITTVCLSLSPHYVTDAHATILDQLGLDSRRLEVPGRKGLERDRGSVIREILA